MNYTSPTTGIGSAFQGMKDAKPSAKSTIDSRISQLDELSQLLDKQIDEHFGHIASVIRSEPESLQQSKEGVPMPVTSPLAERLGTILERLQTISNRVTSVDQRIEL